MEAGNSTKFRQNERFPGGCSAGTRTAEETIVKEVGRTQQFGKRSAEGRSNRRTTPQKKRKAENGRVPVFTKKAKTPRKLGTLKKKNIAADSVWDGTL